MQIHTNPHKQVHTTHLARKAHLLPGPVWLLVHIPQQQLWRVCVRDHKAGVLWDLADLVDLRHAIRSQVRLACTFSIWPLARHARRLTWPAKGGAGELRQALSLSQVPGADGGYLAAGCLQENGTPRPCPRSAPYNCSSQPNANRRATLAPNWPG